MKQNDLVSKEIQLLKKDLKEFILNLDIKSWIENATDKEDFDLGNEKNEDANYFNYIYQNGEHPHWY